MTHVPVSKGRATVSSAFMPLEISIPSRRNWFVILFLPLWLGGWAMGEISAIQSLLRGEGEAGLFLVFWLLGWTVAGAFVMLTLGWQIAGREILRVEAGVLSHRRAIGPVGLTRTYDLAHVKDLRVAPVPLTWQGRQSNPFDISGGPIAFDYGAKTLHVGAGVDEAEAKGLVDTIKRRCSL
jgi:hypothetical protein